VTCTDSMLHPREVVDAALPLAPEEREEIINDLWASLDGGLGEEWEEEIQRWVQDVDAGRVKTIPAEEVFSRLEQHFGGR
jgi:putative addiction module component (TIGR02574 family)